MARAAAVVYGVLALAFGLGMAVTQLRFAVGGCRPCWVAVPIMLAVAGVGAFVLRAGVRRGEEERDGDQPTADR